MAISTAAALLISSIVAAAATGVSAGVSAHQTGEAQDEARRLNDEEIKRQNLRYDDQRRIQMANLKNERKQLALNERAQATNEYRAGTERGATSFKLTQDAIKEVESMLNTNVGLKNMVLQKWGMAA